MMFKRKGGGGQRPFEQCSKKLHFSYVSASLREIYETNSMHTISAKNGQISEEIAFQNPPGSARWTVWGPWSTCSKSCGGGKQSRERKCKKKNNFVDPRTDSNLRIVNVPWECLGKSQETKTCQNQNCPGKE